MIAVLTLRPQAGGLLTVRMALPGVPRSGGPVAIVEAQGADGGAIVRLDLTGEEVAALLRLRGGR